MADKAAEEENERQRDRQLRKARKKADEILEAYAKVQAIDAAKFEDIYEEWVSEDKVPDFEGDIAALTAFANDEIDHPDEYGQPDAVAAYSPEEAADLSMSSVAAMTDARGTGAYMPGGKRGPMSYEAACAFLANPANRSKPGAWRHAQKICQGIAGGGVDPRRKAKSWKGRSDPRMKGKAWKGRAARSKQMAPMYGGNRGAMGPSWISQTAPGSHGVDVMQDEMLYGFAPAFYYNHITGQYERQGSKGPSLAELDGPGEIYHEGIGDEWDPGIGAEFLAGEMSYGNSALDSLSMEELLEMSSIQPGFIY